MDSPPFDDCTYKLNLILAGNAETGKTSVLRRFTDPEGELSTTYISTIGVDYKAHYVPLDDDKVKLQIWDTGGEKRYRAITSAYYRGADGVMVFYDVTRQDTFDDVAYHLDTVRKIRNTNITLMLVGNKCDMSEERVIEYETAKDFADVNDINFLEISAKDGNNVEFLFVTMVAAIGKNSLAAN